MANRLDRDSQLLLKGLRQLGQKGWLGLQLPAHQGGTGMSPENYFLASMMLARNSGALAFLQTQHQSAGGFIAGGRNPAIKSTYLPPMACGQRLIGIGFSHLRRPVPPLRAEPVDGGYRLCGEVPWVTGHGIFTEFVGAATLASGEVVFGILPLVDTQIGDGQITVSEPMALATFGATRTVRVAINDWRLPQTSVVGLKHPGWIHQKDRQGVKAASFALGSAQAALDVAQTSLHKKGWLSLNSSLVALQGELDHCLKQCLEALTRSANTDAAANHQRQLRATAITLAGRCAQAAVAICGGAANGQDHPAQRIYREVLVFTVSGQTPELAAAVVTQLASD